MTNDTILDKRVSFVKIYSLQVVNTNVQFCGSSTLKGHSYTSLIDIDAVEGIVLDFKISLYLFKGMCRMCANY